MTTGCVFPPGGGERGAFLLTDSILLYFILLMFYQERPSMSAPNDKSGTASDVITSWRLLKWTVSGIYPGASIQPKPGRGDESR